MENMNNANTPIAGERTHTVRIQVIKIYDLDIEADSEDNALSQAYQMQTTKIADVGTLVDVTTDFAEVI